ncbi:hypothetical protein FMUND_11624 [Fusarium mundagurra]|uniref:Uncharacterized protein n=1 Tax=Fusarium mundagurra TaxID=1567541 RepID=A0A8H5Y7H1_9HYPO|nr:hypothetical protein FMUND_11624 [Fusarium mundagurra]
MSEQESERAAAGDEAKEFPRPSPKYRSATVDKKNRYPRPSHQFSNARWLARVEKATRADRDMVMAFEALEEQCKKNTEDIRALENKCKELLSTIEALRKELRGESNCVDRV